MLLNYYLAPGGETEAPLPDRVVTVGEHTARMLSADGYGPIIRVGGALQMQSVLGLRSRTDKETERQDGAPVLVAGGNGFGETAELLDLAFQLFAEDDGVPIVVKSSVSSSDHYYMTSASGVTTDGWAVMFAHEVGDRFIGSVDYSIIDAEWAPWMVSGLSPRTVSVLRSGSERCASSLRLRAASPPTGGARLPRRTACSFGRWSDRKQYIRRNGRRVHRGVRGRVAAMRPLIPIVIVTALACQPGDTPPGDTGALVRDSAGGGNGIRSHVLIGVQGVP